MNIEQVNKANDIIAELRRFQDLELRLELGQGFTDRSKTSLDPLYTRKKKRLSNFYLLLAVANGHELE